MTEKEIITTEQLRLSPEGWRIWRTVPGLLWKGKLLNRSKDRRTVLLGEFPTPITLFPPGEPDGHLARPATITPDMVGQVILRFGKFEVKTRKYKTVTQEQLDNLRATAAMGGLAYIWHEQPDGSISWEEVRG